MKKILYITSTLEASGPNNQLLGLINGLDPEEFQAEILTLSPEKKNTMIRKFQEKHIKTESLRLSRLQFQLYGKRILEQYIKRECPDIIHTQGVRADSAVTGLGRYESIHCMTLHNYMYEDYADKYGAVKGRYFNYLHYRAIKRARYPICCSQSLALKYEELFGRPFCFVRNGVDPKRFYAGEQERVPGNVCFVTAGDLIPRKDPLTILEAFGRLGDSREAQLHILGDGALMERCREKAVKNVYLHGAVKDVLPFFQKADYYISASRSEGLPNAVLEAGMCGCRLILSDIPQHREIADAAGEVIADFFEPGNAEELSRLLAAATPALEQSGRDAVSALFRKRCSSQEMSRGYQTIYRSITEGNQ